MQRLNALRLFNEPSRNAILRIGATQEGIFRQHMVIAATGRLRDTVYFSILDTEWPAVKQRLTSFEGRLLDSRG